MAIKARSLDIFTMKMNLNILKTVGGIADGLSNIIRGVTQILATPLTWFLKIPLRGTITLIKGQPTVAQEVEQRVEALETQIKKKEKTLEDTQAIDSEMYSISMKLIKNVQRGQEPGVDIERAASKFAQCKKFTEKKESRYYGTSYYPDNSEHTQTRALNYLGLFKPDAPETPDVNEVLCRWDYMSGNSYV